MFNNLLRGSNMIKPEMLLLLLGVHVCECSCVFVCKHTVCEDSLNNTCVSISALCKCIQISHGEFANLQDINGEQVRFTSPLVCHCGINGTL